MRARHGFQVTIGWSAVVMAAVVVVGCSPLRHDMSQEALEAVVAREFRLGESCAEVDARLVKMRVPSLRREWKEWPPPAESTLIAHLGDSSFLLLMTTWWTQVHLNFDSDERLVGTRVLKFSASP